MGSPDPQRNAESVVAMARLSEHLQYLADMLIKAAGALPDGDPWVKVSGVAIELTRLSQQFAVAAEDPAEDDAQIDGTGCGS